MEKNQQNFQKPQEPKILKNAAKCRSCLEILESTHVHDFRVCKCGKVGVDGGKTYIRRLGLLADMEELSEWSK